MTEKAIHTDEEIVAMVQQDSEDDEEESDADVDTHNLKSLN